jgi:hypothetical protein
MHQVSSHVSPVSSVSITHPPGFIPLTVQSHPCQWHIRHDLCSCYHQCHPSQSSESHPPGFIQHVSSVVIRVSDISGMIHVHAWHRCHPSRCSHLDSSDSMQMIIYLQMFVSHYFKHWFMQKIRPVSAEKRCKLCRGLFVRYTQPREAGVNDFNHL